MIHYVDSPVIEPKNKRVEKDIKESKTETKSKSKLAKEDELNKDEIKNISSFGKFLTHTNCTLPQALSPLHPLGIALL